MSSSEKIPTHVAIIMDGNGRWAAGQGLDRLQGHGKGAESVKACIEGAIRAGVGFLTFYAFSTENWARPTEEVEGLMGLFCSSVASETDELVRQGVRVKVIGSREELSPRVKEHISLIESETATGDRLTVVLALNYSSRDEIRRAVEMAGVDFENHLDTAGIPDPDLIIRTGGEKRLSNFLLWQGAYSELYFTDTMWPEFTQADFNDALAEYAARERRFGKIPN